MAWERLVRFKDSEGIVRFGDLVLEQGQDIRKLEGVELYASGYEGTSPFGLKPTGTKHKVAELLSVIDSSDVPIIKCVGLNYMKHIQEGGRKPPPYPSIFIKPRTSVAGHNEDIPIHSICQQAHLDYEGELAIVIGQSGKNIPKQDALQYVAGFVASNDVSTRRWQKDPAYAGGVPQWCFSKGFDKFAPLSPVLVSPKVVGNAGQLRLQTIVNGEVRQDTSTDDLLFNVESIIEFVSQGSTLEKGTVILTGTPAGVAMGMAEPKWLKNGDVVEVSIENLGSVKNKMVFE